MRNKNYILIPILFLTLSLKAFCQENGQIIMNLTECLQYAYEHNEQVIIANLEREASKAYVGEIMSDGLPQIEASAEFKKNLKIRTTLIDANSFNPTIPEGDSLIQAQFGTPYEGDIGINATQMVFDGSYFVGLKAARTFKELSNKDYIKTKTDVAEAVSKAYYSVLVNEEALRLIEINFQRLDSLLRETRIMYENGMAEKIDVSRVQVQYNNMKTNLSNQQRLLGYSKNLLKFQMGMNLNTDLNIADKPSDLEVTIVHDLEEEINYNQRIEYEQLFVNQQLAELDLKNNHVQYLPKVDIYFGFGLNAGTGSSDQLLNIGGPSWFDYQTVGLRGSLPIFDGLKKAKRIQQNRIKLEQIDYQFAQLRKQINIEIINSKINLQNSMDDLENQIGNMQLAEEVYNISKIKYQEGVGSNIELTEADNAFKQAQSNYFSALLETLLAKVDYEKALGILLKN